MMSTARLTITTMRAMNVTSPWTRDVVARVDVLDQLGAQPWPVEGALGEHRPGERERHLQADDRDDRDQRVAERVAAYDGPLA